MARFSRFFARHATLSDDGKAECSPLVPDSPASGSRVLPENAADHQLLMSLHMFDNTPRMKRQPSQESTRSKASCHH